MKIDKSKVLNILHKFIFGIGILACIFGILYVITLFVPSTSEKLNSSKTVATSTFTPNLSMETMYVKKAFDFESSSKMVNVVVKNNGTKDINSEKIHLYFYDSFKNIVKEEYMNDDECIKPNETKTLTKITDFTGCDSLSTIIEDYDY